MSVFTSIASRARDAASAAQSSLERARIERTRRLTERRQEAAFAALGRRVRELVLADEIPGDRLEPELASVRALEMQVEALQAEIDELVVERPDETAPPAASTADDAASTDTPAATTDASPTSPEATS